MHRSMKILMLVSGAALFACGGSVGIGVGGAGVAVGAGASTGKAASMSKAEHRKDVDEWFAGRIQRLHSETGWLTLVGLFQLPEGTHTFGGADDNEMVFAGDAPAHAGTITVAGGSAHLEVAKGVTMTHEGTPVTSIDMVADSGDSGNPTEIRMGTYDFYVIERQKNLYLRVKDSNSEVLREFKGIERYPVDMKWRVAAHLDPYDPPRRLTIPNVLGFDEVVDCHGALVFEFDGQEYRLEPMSEGDGEMFIVFGDATSGQETYGGGRFVYVESPDENGNTYIDFNRAYNPPCVFTPYATCPLPHRENILPFRIEAGEKNWEHVPAH
ncbi:MAG TPA: DUF1684 domain-containing protein [Candidatus Krumholzibacteria bacterium]|nr:DUF1684 domain-containing protein [Candidatus Krumholzibacteria bacterium]